MPGTPYLITMKTPDQNHREYQVNKLSAELEYWKQRCEDVENQLVALFEVAKAGEQNVVLTRGYETIELALVPDDDE